MEILGLDAEQHVEMFVSVCVCGADVRILKMASSVSYWSHTGRGVTISNYFSAGAVAPVVAGFTPLLSKFVSS